MTAIVTGAGRGFGRAIATALTATGRHVVGVSRTRAADAPYETVTADAADPDVAAALIQQHRPRVLVPNAGVVPAMGPVDALSWAEFERNWQVDTRHVFEWTKAALRLPLEPGSIVVAMSSGAALRGSPVSGGYAGAKAAIRFIATYGADESRRELGLRFATVMPPLTPATELGRAGVAGYAARNGTEPDYRVTLTAEQVAQHVLGVIEGSEAYTEGVVTG
ncbi:SDR family oxidoreductase [Actinoplanes auranticolor]|uniref:Short-chain dehydrogenase n=1 Tax=Actinoplanes auranticolor TaxID=47988 RepID=A0A919VJA3_9ACTN|nr:SDR family oxidoreductase [Actinoplanes auranticolor]GIM64320.1 short-chain dehydrogenase [Actinoplanes auranticolor]